MAKRSKKRKSSKVERTLFSHLERAAGAGRPKKKGKDARVSHQKREEHKKAHPILITKHVVDGLPNLCVPEILAIVGAATRQANGRRMIRVIHFTLQSNHIHLVCEATSKTDISRGLNGLFCSLAKRLNKAFDRQGRIWDDRYDRQDLTTPTRLRRALRYVFQNVVKHTRRALPLAPGGQKRPDPFSSGAYFDGWIEQNLDLSPPFGLPRPTTDPDTWLLRVGWRKAGGPISIDEYPKAA